MKKRILVIASVLILTLAVLFILVCFAAGSYAKNNINTEYDEKLFENAIGSSSTTFFADSDYGDDEYIPVKIDIGGEYKKIYYELDEISDYLIDGFIAVEDRRFYSHSGVDIKRTLYAAVNYILKREKVFGASTITQQVVKNISGDNQLSVRRKLNEILRAYNIERKHTKSEILEVYLNIVPMSSGIVGVGAASEFYFGKAPNELSVSEAATLIGITNAPSAYDPYKHEERCIQKRNIVLETMKNQGVITDAEYKIAVSEPLSLIEKESNIDSWFIETVTEDVIRDYAAENKISESLSRLLIMSGGYSIYTTVNMKVQSILEEYFENEANLPKEVARGLDYSMVVIDPENGDILGIIGGSGKKSGNRITNNAEIPHIPASTLKPIALYAPLIDEGKISWRTVFDDIPVSFSSAEQGYTAFPRNSPDVYDGLVTVKEAIKKSKNTVAVQLCKMRGVDSVFSTLKNRYGFDTLVESQKRADGATLTDKAVSPMALGQLTNGVSLRKLTEAYTAFPNDGVRASSRTYIAVMDKDGNTVLKKENSGNRVMRSETAKIMNQLLSEVITSGTARSVSLKQITSVAGKTGTSGGGYDKMFIGYTPFAVAGIWCGYNNGKTAVSTSGKTHLEIWDAVMQRICQEVFCDRLDNKFSTDGLIYAPYCMDSGLVYSHNCIYDPRGSRMEYGYFTKESVPRSECKTHILVNYDMENKGIVMGNTGDGYARVSLVKNEGRSFPKEIYITDAEYVYRNVRQAQPQNNINGLPYFYSELREGEYAGVSKKKRQFNSYPENLTQ